MTPEVDSFAIVPMGCSTTAGAGQDAIAAMTGVAIGLGILVIVALGSFSTLVSDFAST